MNIPEELRYTKSHEWLKEEDGVYTCLLYTSRGV